MLPIHIVVCLLVHPVCLKELGLGHSRTPQPRTVAIVLEHEMSELKTFPVTVQIGATGFATEISSGKHSLRADEPESVGGTDTGPTPYDLLLSALGTCTAMTLRMYADRKGWPLTGATVELHHDRVHARDCAECETETGYISRITKRVSLSGNLDNTQRKRLLEIADRCPVHRTLTSEILVSTELGSA